MIEGEIESDGRLIFWWPAGARRILFQTSGSWAWEYRKQCQYCNGYSYLDADTGVYISVVSVPFSTFAHSKLLFAQDALLECVGVCAVATRY